jgi:Mn2+/Fe2+ NRAMP family transporter
MSRLANILFWSVISAAFIGPGTVTTASSAGASYGTQLAWALVFSTIACIVLQEAVARLVIRTGESLGTAIRVQAGNEAAGRVLALLVGVSIVLGCAAYEAGNILGGVAGIQLLLPESSAWMTRAITALTGLVAAALLWSGTAAQISRALGLVVASMGVAFVVTAIRLGPDLGALFAGAVLPPVPAGAEVLALGLVGTTVVPYNLFLGAGLARGQALAEMRLGLIVAIALGGVISLAVMVVGSGLAGPMQFDALASMLRERLGPGGQVLFAFGLFAAGFSSAVTAPLAAALTVQSLTQALGDTRGNLRSPRMRSVWMGVLAIGIAFGVSGLRPVPVIVLAQALNGLVLPLVAVLVLHAVNDRARLGPVAINGLVANLLGLGCVAVTVAMGVNGLGRVVALALGLQAPSPRLVLRISAVVMVGVLVFLVRARRRAYVA